METLEDTKPDQIEETPVVETEITSEASSEEQVATPVIEEDYGTKVKKRISHLTSNIKGLQNQVESRDKRIAELENTKLDVKVKPMRTQFESEDEYLESLTDWKVSDTLNKKDMTERETLKNEKKSLQEQISNDSKVAFFDKVVDAKQRIPDIEEKLSKIHASDIMLDEIFTSEVGPDMAYYLATHPEEAIQVKTLSEKEAIRYMLKLEANVKHNTIPIKSNAPPPLDVVDGSDAPTTDTSKLTQQQRFELREKKRFADLKTKYGG